MIRTSSLSKTVCFFLLCFSLYNGGYSQVSLNLSDYNNYYCYQSSDSTLWISSLNAVNRYDGETTKIYWPEPAKKYGLNEGLNQSPFVEDDEGNIWFTTVNYLVKWNKEIDGFENFQVDTSSTSYRLIDVVDSLAYLQVGKTVYSFDLNQYKFNEIYNGFQGIEFILNVDQKRNFHSLYGSRWNYGKGLLRLTRTEKGGFDMDTLGHQLEVRQLREIDNKIYFSTKNGIYNLKGDELTEIVKSPISLINVSASNRLIFSDTKSVYEVLENGSVDKILDQSAQGVFNPVQDVFITSIGDEGLKIVNSKNSGFKFEKSKSISNSVIRLNKSIFYSFLNGDVMGFNGEDFELICNALYDPVFVLGEPNALSVLSNYSYQTVEGKKIINKSRINNLTNIRGALWLGGEKLLVVDKNEVFVWSEKSNEKNILHRGSFYDQIFYEVGNFLYASDLKNIYVFKIEIENVRLDHLIPFETGVTQYLEQSDSTLLLGSSEGIKILNKRSREISDYKYLEHYIQTLLYDLNGDLWFGTRNGLYHETKEGKLLMYNEKSGLESHTFSADCSTVGHDGTLYFGTNKGVLYFHPDSIKSIDYNPNLMMTSLKVHGHEWMNDTVNIEVVENVDLEYNENTLTFDFVAVDYTENNHPQYSVLLEGYDVDTTLLGDQSVITYPNLKPGNYTFKYGVCTLSGNCKEEFSTLEITILPPYWQTWWFRSLLWLMALSIVGGTIILYLKNKLREQKFAFEKQELVLKTELQLQQERNRIADELHDELGGKLSSIKFASKKIQRADSINDVKTITSRVAEISSEMIESMRSIIWAMDTQNDTYESFTSYLRNFSSTLAEDNDLSIKCDFQSIEQSVYIKGQIRHHLSLAIKEILNNIIKHSTANEVIVTAKVESNVINVVVTENGSGFDPAALNSSGKGLNSIRKRMSSIKGEVHFSKSDWMITKFSVPLA